MAVEYNLILSYVVGIIILYILGRVFFTPLTIFLKLAYKTVLGGAILLGLNYLGNYIGFNLPFNVITACIIGVLGIPGMLLLSFLKYFFF